MADGERHDDPALDAGAFSAWLGDVRSAIRGEQGSEVPCGTCTACCRSSQFVHVGPDETDTLAHIPADLLFPAPGLPPGHVLMGHDEGGHCPMLVDERCSIYQHRPVTCRTYDCRVFPAAGVDPGGDKPAIARQARRWRFRHPARADRVAHDAVQAAASYLGDPVSVPPEDAPATATQLAVIAVQLHDLFLGRDPATGEAAVVEPTPSEVRIELARRRSR
jgi:hypothetical protein